MYENVNGAADNRKVILSHQESSEPTPKIMVLELKLRALRVISRVITPMRKKNFQTHMLLRIR